jgi:hypothetical protein
MSLRRNSEISQDDHGIRAMGYTVEFATAPVGGFADPKTAAWKTRLVRLNSIHLGYGLDHATAEFTTFDPDAVSEETSENTGELLRFPQNGECVRVTVRDDFGDSYFVFKGTIRAVKELRQGGVILWNFTAVSESSRLDESHITAIFNRQNDPINPQPFFDAGTGKVNSVARQYTIKEVVTEILKFKDPWGTDEYFAPTDVEWGTLETDPQCGAFIPSQLGFDNVPKGRAIQRVLEQAGRFTFLYNPATDKLRIVRLDKGCAAVGPAWPLNFAPITNDDAGEPVPYAIDYVVTEDRTEWTTRDSANVCRMMGGPVNFYSGHHIIPERVTSPADQDVVSDGFDTSIDQKKRSINPDGAYFRFVFPTNMGTNDTRTLRRNFVGMPLFPDWNVFEDWWPAVYEVSEPHIPAGWTGPAATEYRGKAEFQPHCIGDQAARREIHLGRQDNLRVYQAWHAPSDCPACNGTGWVKKIYSNAQNEPNLSLVLRGPAGRQRRVIECTNWIMKPSEFGTLTTVPAGLVAFDPADSTDPVVQITGGYPLPWKNTCPFCRGVGRKPEYKIRNIEGELFSSRNLKVSLDPNVHEIPADPDHTQTGPETWEEAVNRVSLRVNPAIAVEVDIRTNKHVLPNYEHRNKDYTVLQTTVPVEERRYRFPHPLSYTNVVKNLAGMPGVEVLVGDEQGRDKIVPPSWGCHVPFTTVMTESPVSYRIDNRMGRVIFEEPIFVPCTKEYASVYTMPNNKTRLDPTGLLSTHSPARGYVTSDDRGLPSGYWRPAKIWLHFLHTRENYYNRGDKKPDGSDLEPTEFTYGGANYAARAAILDGRYALEVKKLDAEGEEISTIGRTIQMVDEDQTSRIEVHESDFWKLPVPPAPDMNEVDYIAAKATALCHFPKGKLLQWVRPTQGELLAEVDGFTSADHFASAMRPKSYVWTLRDDRPRLLGKAVRALELANDVQVEGELVVVGPMIDLSQGLGYVDYPDKGKAYVVRATLSFTDGIVAEIELQREEFRLGEATVEEKDRQHKVEKEIANLRRTVDVQREAAAKLKTGNESVTDASGIRFFSGGG